MVHAIFYSTDSRILVAELGVTFEPRLKFFILKRTAVVIETLQALNYAWGRY